MLQTAEIVCYSCCFTLPLVWSMSRWEGKNLAGCLLKFDRQFFFSSRILSCIMHQILSFWIPNFYHEKKKKSHLKWCLGIPESAHNQMKELIDKESNPQQLTEHTCLILKEKSIDDIAITYHGRVDRISEYFWSRGAYSSMLCLGLWRGFYRGKRKDKTMKWKNWIYFLDSLTFSFPWWSLHKSKIQTQQLNKIGERNACKIFVKYI